LVDCVNSESWVLWVVTELELEIDLSVIPKELDHGGSVGALSKEINLSWVSLVPDDEASNLTWSGSGQIRSGLLIKDVPGWLKGLGVELKNVETLGCG
jgi:hypothetical protein